MARTNKRTKKQYCELFDNPERLFPGVQMTMWPNGQPEIWFQSKDGLGFRLRVSNGPAGFGLTVSRFTGTAPLTIAGNQDDGNMSTYAGPDMYELTATQYRFDARSQQFKAWYRHDLDPSTGEPVPHPEEVKA